jgi:hypothetical protein
MKERLKCSFFDRQMQLVRDSKNFPDSRSGLVPSEVVALPSSFSVRSKVGRETG